jgi:hypothetical protein
MTESDAPALTGTHPGTEADVPGGLFSPAAGSEYIANIGGGSIQSVTSVSRCNATDTTDTTGGRRPAASKLLLELAI